MKITLLLIFIATMILNGCVTEDDVSVEMEETYDGGFFIDDKQAGNDALPTPEQEPSPDNDVTPSESDNPAEQDQSEPDDSPVVENETTEPDDSPVVENETTEPDEPVTPVDNDVVEEDWYDGTEKLQPSFSLDCNVPEMMFTNPAEDFAMIQYKGELFQNTNGEAANGQHAYLVKLNNSEMDIDSESAQSFYIPKTTGSDVISIQSVGGVKELIAQKHYTYKLSQLNIMVDTLKELKSHNNEGGEFKNTDSTRHYIFLTLDMEQKYESSTHYYQKRCFSSVDNIANVYGKMYACTASNNNFGVGEMLQVMASVEISDDEAALLAVQNPICMCFDSASGEIDCSEFDAFQP